MAPKPVTASNSTLFLLFLSFLVLKLCDYIDWSWWWITAPLWLPFALLVAIRGAERIVDARIKRIARKAGFRL